jgi:hypothetical protein
MAKHSSLISSLDVSVDEKIQFDPCATTSTDIPINDELVAQRAEPVCLENETPDSHHHLSTLALLTAHIGYVNFYLSHPHLMAYSQGCFNSVPCNH